MTTDIYMQFIEAACCTVKKFSLIYIKAIRNASYFMAIKISDTARNWKKMISMKNFSQVLGPTIAQKLHLLKLQMTCFLRQTKAASRC